MHVLPKILFFMVVPSINPDDKVSLKYILRQFLKYQKILGYQKILKYQIFKLGLRNECDHWYVKRKGI